MRTKTAPTFDQQFSGIKDMLRNPDSEIKWDSITPSYKRYIVEWLVTELDNRIYDDPVQVEKPNMDRIQERLAYLRTEIEMERISYGEILELQSLAPYIDHDDVQLLQWIDPIDPDE